MAAKSPKSAAPAEKPARKGTARTSRAASKSPVKTRTLTAAEKRAGQAKLGKPKPTRAAAKPAPKRTPKPATSARAGDGGITAATRKKLDAVAKLRAKGVKWEAISAETGESLGTLARLRKLERTKGASRF